MSRVMTAALAALATAAAGAAEPPRAIDPYVAPAARIRSTEPPSSGTALQAQVQDKLRRRFEAADATGFGSISKAQAERAGFGFVAQHFERIDSTRSGSVTFEEFRRWLASQR